MPRGDGNEPHRIVLDESSFDFRGLSDELIESHLDDLNNALAVLNRPDGVGVARPPMWDLTECLDDCELFQFLCRERPSMVDPDTLRRTYQLLDRCPEWPDPDDLDLSVTVADEQETPARLSVAYAHHHALVRRGVACLVFPGVSRRGFNPTLANGGEADIFFFAVPDDLKLFWRHLFTFEDVPENDFFTLARLAFPNLVFHPDLAFGRFDGAYRDLRNRVIAILCGLCDHFSREYVERHGLAREVRAALGQHGVDMSPESPNTRGSKARMNLRTIVLHGEEYRCEWHAKLEPHRNRIHLATPDTRLGGRILIGIFVDHLPT